MLFWSETHTDFLHYRFGYEVIRECPARKVVVTLLYETLSHHSSSNLEILWASAEATRRRVILVGLQDAREQIEKGVSIVES